LSRSISGDIDSTIFNKGAVTLRLDLITSVDPPWVAHLLEVFCRVRSGRAASGVWVYYCETFVRVICNFNLISYCIE
jgi:hypothetical protein